MVNYQVMSDTHHPGDKFAVILVFPGPDGLDNFHEGILKEILNKRLIAYIQAYICEYFILMTVD
jgi:hypothetical protein